MRLAIAHLNYLAVLVVAVAGFLLGWLWYGMLFGRVWMREMKITPERMEASKQKGMARYFIEGFTFTLLGTFGLAVVIATLHSPNWKHGLAVGAFVGLFISGARLLNTSVWEDRSWLLRTINVGHEVALFALQGAILGIWR